MAREVLVSVWCDVHYRAEPQERREVTYTDDVLINGVKKRVELCEECSAPFRAAAEVVRLYGTDPVGRPAGPQQPPLVAGGNRHKLPVPSHQAGSGGECPDPDCRAYFDKRANLTSHSRNVHGMNLTDLELKHGVPVSGRKGRYSAQQPQALPEAGTAAA